MPWISFAAFELASYVMWTIYINRTHRQTLPVIAMSGRVRLLLFLARRFLDKCFSYSSLLFLINFDCQLSIETRFLRVHNCNRSCVMRMNTNGQI